MMTPLIIAVVIFFIGSMVADDVMDWRKAGDKHDE
jgi:1,4-dihydroxy-2-naphthoate octaprenyltransferase